MQVLRWMLTGAWAVIATGALGGCRDTATVRQTGDAGRDEVVVSGQASWPTYYGSIAALTADAPLVVVGAVTGVANATAVEQSAGAVTASLIFTDVTVRIDRVLRGTAPGATVQVRQTGGTANGTRLEVADDPLLQVGDQYVLFLRPGGADTYAVVGGPQGRLVLRNGRVSSLSTVYPRRRIFDLGLENTPLTEIAAAVRRDGS